MTKQQATSLTNSILTTTCCLHTWALHSSRFMHTDTQTNRFIGNRWVCFVVCFARPLFSQFSLNPGHPVALFLCLWWMCELSGSPRSSSLREFYYSCVSLQSDPSRAFSLPLYAHIHSNLLCPSSFRHRTFTWKWNGSLRVGVGAACTHMMVSNFNVAVIAEAFSVVYGIITILEKSCKKVLS